MRELWGGWQCPWDLSQPSSARAAAQRQCPFGAGHGSAGQSRGSVLAERCSLPVLWVDMGVWKEHMSRGAFGVATVSL